MVHEHARQSDPCLLSDPATKGKRLQFFLSVEDFTASTGWLQHFKERYNTVGRVISRECIAVDVEDINKWVNEEWPVIVT